MNIRTRLLVGVTSMLAVTCFILALTGYLSGRKALEEAAFSKLTSLRESNADHIEDYFGHIKKQVTTFSESKTIVQSMHAFKEAFHAVDSLQHGPWEKSVSNYYTNEFQPRYGSLASVDALIPTDPKIRYWQNWYLSSNPNPTGEKDALMSAPDGSEYSAIHARFHPIIRTYQKTFGYYDIFLIDPQTGHIVYSVFKEIDFATSLFDGPYKDTNFARAVRAASNATDPGIAVLEDFEPYIPSYGAPASFIASPIVENGSLIGVLAFQMPVDNINKVMTGGRKWSERGLGASGETYLIGSDFTMRSIARQLIEEPESYFKNLETTGVNEETRRNIQAFGTSILLQPVNTEASNAVMNGVAGAQIIDNYQGESVLSSYRPLDIEGVDWAIIAEIHKKEAFQGIQSFVFLMVLSGLSVLCIAFFVALQFAKSFTRPIVELKNAASLVAEGDDSVHLPVVRKDEFGSLATAFNQMTRSIRESKATLEKERDAIQHRVDEAVEIAQEHQKYLHAQVSRMLEAMNQFSRGDLTVTLQGTTDDEIASLFDGFTRAIGNIRAMLQSAQDGAIVAQKTADKINGIMEEVLTDSYSQASHAEETTSAITKLVETVHHNAQSTTNLSSTAHKCSEVSESGGKILHGMVDQMQQISEDVFAAEEIIQSLGTSGQEIGGIINVIAEIADQTNLLALNAAIEAARAGEQGKGFAVVADEVRKLAERTSSSTREIMNMIQGIQAETKAAIEAMSKGRKRVSDGVSMANQARESLEDINNTVNLLVKMVYQIAEATEEQAAMSTQITESVNSILTGARNSAEQITESVKAVEKLYVVNEELSKNLDEFVLRPASRE